MSPSYPYHVYSPEVLATTPIPAYNREALPYLLRDRRETIEGGMRYNPETKEHEHDTQGVEYARDKLRRVKHRLEGDVSADMRAILLIQLAHYQGAVEFWEGKLWMLDQMIALAKGAP